MTLVLLYIAQLVNIYSNKMCVLVFCTNFVWNIAHNKKEWAKYDKKLYIGQHANYPLFYYNETWIFSTDFRRILNIKFRENPSSESRVVPCGQTDRYDKANSYFSQFCKRA